LRPCYPFFSNRAINSIDMFGLVLQFVGCDEFEQKLLREAWDRACTAIASDRFKSCMCKDVHTTCLRGKCQRQEVTFTCEHYESLDKCKPVPPSDQSPCAAAYENSRDVYICPKAWNNVDGHYCGPLECVLAHEVMHNCMTAGSGEKWPCKAQECAGTNCPRGGNCP